MKTILKSVVLVLFVFLMGCNKSQRPISIVLEGSPETVAAARDWLEKNPQAAESFLGGKFVIEVVEPESQIDHKLVFVSSDPDIDLKIRVIDPQVSGMAPEMRQINREMAESIRRDIQRQTDIRK